jgi:hypothetical protein
MPLLTQQFGQQVRQRKSLVVSDAISNYPPPRQDLQQSGPMSADDVHFLRQSGPSAEL